MKLMNMRKCNRERDRYFDRLHDNSNQKRRAFADLLDGLQKTEVYGSLYEKYNEGRVVTELDPAALWSNIRKYFKSTDDSVQRSLMNRLDQIQIGDEEIQKFITKIDDIICLINPPMSDSQKLRQLKRDVQHQERFKMAVQASNMFPETNFVRRLFNWRH
jgi:hypothetical protein